jgi:hypothetical protein
MDHVCSRHLFDKRYLDDDGQFELPLPNGTPRTIVRLSLARARYTYKIQDLFTRARDTAAAMLVRHGNRQ